MSPRWLIGGGLLVVVVVALAIVLIGSGDDSASSTTVPAQGFIPGTPSEEQQAQLEAFRACLSEQGVEPPQPGTAQGPSPEMLQALEQCRQYVPDGFGPVP
jgi:hypothetical protein